MAVLIARKVHKEYELGAHRVLALAGVDFQVEQGEFVAVMGPSGSGKSTLLHLLGGLDSPTHGSIQLAGQELGKLEDRAATLARRHHIGFVFQFYNLLPTLTAGENILLPVLIDGKKVREYQERLDQLLQLVGLSDRGDHKPDQLSGGEQQRVALARALITSPAIVLADEPTGNLDSRNGRTIMELLRRSCDELNQAIVVVTHDPRAAAFADRVVFLRDGIIEQELMSTEDASFSLRMRSIMDVMEKLEL